MSWKKELEQFDGVQIEVNKDLTKNSTMKLVAFGDLITVRSVDGLKKLLPHLKKNRIKPVLLGLGANQILPTKSDSPYIKLNLPFDKTILDEFRPEYTLPASLTLNTLTAHAQKFGNDGWEVFTGIPATLGGAIFMNAGTALGEIGELVTRVWVITEDGEEKQIVINNKSFSYRKNNFLSPGDVIVSATLKHKGHNPGVTQKIKTYLEYRWNTQPMNAKTCGCILKNAHVLFEESNETMTCRAGHYVDILGLKGLTINNIKIGHKHANFMENLGDANHEDVKKAVKVVLNELYLHYGIKFETEVELP